MGRLIQNIFSRMGVIFNRGCVWFVVSRSIDDEVVFMNSIDIVLFLYLFFSLIFFDKRNGWRWSCAGFSYALCWAIASSVC